MAFDANGHWISTDQPSQTHYRDFSNYLAGVMRVQTNLLSMVNQGEPARSRKIEWGKVSDGNSKYLTTTNDAGGTLSNVGTTFTVSASTFNRLAVGMILCSTEKHNVVRPSGVNGYELLYISSLDVVGSDYVVTVVRDYGHDTSGETLPSYHAAEEFEIQNAPQLERSTAGRNNWFGSSTWDNIMQIFRKDLAVSGTYQEVEIYGTSTQSLATQIAEMTEEMMREFLSALIRGKRHPVYPLGGPDANGNEVRRTMDGILPLCVAHGAYNDTTTIHNETLYNRVAAELESRGALANRRLQAIMNPRRIDEAASWDRDKIRIDPNMTSRGAYVTTYVTSRAVTVDLISDPYIRPSEMIFGDMSYASIRPLGSRKWFSFKYKNPGEDGDCAAIIGEWSLELREANKRFAFCMNLD